MLRAALLLVIGLTLTGCSTKFEVESNTTWTGNVNGASVEGSGNKTYSTKRGEAAVFQKNTETGFLRARAKTSGLFGAGEWVRTEAAYGVVTVVAD